MWGFRSEPGIGPPRRIARDFLKANAGLLQLDGTAGHLRVQREIESLGAWHVIAQQDHLGLRIHRAYVTVHIGRDRCVHLTKNRAVPRALLPAKAVFRLTATSARRRARRAIRAGKAEIRGLGTERLWFPEKGVLRPAWKLRLHRDRPRAEWIVYVDAVDGRVLSKHDNLAGASGVARVFDPNPVVALGDWRGLVADGRPLTPPDSAYVERVMPDLAPTGFLEGPRVSTRPTARRIRRPEGKFLYLESLGYRGTRAIFRHPVAVDARGTAANNSWYSPGLRQLTFGTGGVDDAEDAEVILHELGHAIQDAICHDFGQSDQAAAMGEGFGDYFAARGIGPV